MLRRSILVAGAAIAIAALASGAAERDAGTGYQLENVEVLDPSMGLKAARRHMMAQNEALGVKCRDCHDVRDFPSDEMPLKIIARDMMKMTRDINEKWFPGQDADVVTCWTCHRGNRVPRRPIPTAEALGTTSP